MDVKNLREDNVRRFFDGNWWIIVRHHKTGVEGAIRRRLEPAAVGSFAV
ncbi:MAG: hypothetical protein IJU08_07545 [Bacteroidales bacterium]|nr:hypothetical protein [Bacteroidales bacterium]MBQ9398332.1 hypothetical protein [Bacteroidales bacterium]